MHLRGQETITDCYEVIVMRTVMKMKACYSGLVFPGQERKIDFNKLIQYLDHNCFLWFYGWKNSAFYSQTTLWRNSC